MRKALQQNAHKEKWEPVEKNAKNTRKYIKRSEYCVNAGGTTSITFLSTAGL